MLTCTAEIEGCKGGHEETCGPWRRRLLGSGTESLCEIGDEGMMCYEDTGDGSEERGKG